MATREIVALDAAANKLDVPQAGDTYIAKSAVHLEQPLTTDSTIDGRDIAADGAVLDTALQPGDDVTDLNTDHASQAEAEAGSENTKTMTALRVAQAIAILAAGLQNKLNGTVAPDNTNDNTEGYSVGSFWIDTVGLESYRCIDATTNLAVWVKTTLVTTDLAAVAISGDSDDLVEGTVQLLLTPAERLMISEAGHAYGILNANDVAVPENTVDATPRQITAWGIDGLNENTTPDHTSDDITINADGDYSVDVSISFSGTASKTFRMEIYKNGSPTGFACMRKLGTGGDVGDVSFHGFLVLNVNDVISVYQHSTDGGSNLTITDAQLKVERLGS